MRATLFFALALAWTSCLAGVGATSPLSQPFVAELELERRGGLEADVVVLLKTIDPVEGVMRLELGGVATGALEPWSFSSRSHDEEEHRYTWRVRLASEGFWWAATNTTSDSCLGRCEDWSIHAYTGQTEASSSSPGGLLRQLPPPELAVRLAARTWGAEHVESRIVAEARSGWARHASLSARITGDQSYDDGATQHVVDAEAVAEGAPGQAVLASVLGQLSDGDRAGFSYEVFVAVPGFRATERAACAMHPELRRSGDRVSLRDGGSCERSMAIARQVHDDGFHILTTGDLEERGIEPGEWQDLGPGRAAPWHGSFAPGPTVAWIGAVLLAGAIAARRPPPPP